MYRYGFSATSSVTISEFLKFLLSSFFFWREFKRRAGASSISQDTPNAGSVTLEEIEEGKERPRDSEELNFEDEDPLHGSNESFSSPRTTFAAFVQAVKDEIPSETRYGFAHLALFYVLINNIVS